MERLRSLAAWCLPAALAATLLWYGGAGAQARSLALALLAGGLLLAALAARRGARPPPILWWACLFAVPLLQPLLQALPLGVGHPWADADRTALGTTPTAWALDPAASWRAAAWAVAAAATTLLAAWAWRGERLVRLAMAVTAIAAAHAALAPFLAIVIPDWPNALNAGRVRGTFVYPNHAAAFWAAVLPMALCLARADRAHRPAWLAAAAALAAALVLSASRGGILVATLCCLPLAWGLLPRRGRWGWAVLGGLVVTAWLWAADVRAVGERFGRLADEHNSSSGITMSGRLLIYQATIPALPDAGAWGLGGGGASAAFLRGGASSFGDAKLLSLHSDPLEWLVERGWAGTALGLLGVAAAAWLVLKRRREIDGDARAGAVALGAAVGLLHLAVHGCGEFVWQREAIVLLACIWLAVAAGAGRVEEQPGPTRRWRLGLVLAALLAAVAMWIERPLAAEARLAFEARRDGVARQRDGLDPLGAARVREALASEPRGPDLAVLQAELFLILPGADADPLTSAERALARAAALAPAHPEAWIWRLRLATLRADALALRQALERVEARAPGRPEARWCMLAAVLGPAAGALPESRQRELMRAVLTGASPPPPGFWEAAESLLGADDLAIALVEAPGPALRRAGEPWLRRHGSLAAWLAVRASQAPQPPLCAPALATVATQTWGVLPLLRLPTESEQLRAQAEQLRGLAMPLPRQLAETLSAHGGALAVLARRPHWPTGKADDFLAASAATAEPLAALLHLPWARQAWEEARLAAAISAGTAEATVTAPPALLQANWQLAQGEAKERLAVALGAIDRGWEELPGLGHARWWRGDVAAPLVNSEDWVGLLIDGQWMGWRRGLWQVPEMGPGLHRIVVLQPPVL